MKFFIYILALATLLVSCKQSNDEQKNTPDTNNTEITLQPEQFYGEWRNLSMRVTTAYNTSQSAVEEYNEENWEKELKIKPIRTYYKPDGKYLSEYRDLDDTVIGTTSGNWSVKQDSVYLNQTQPDILKAAYHVQFHDKNTATFTAMLDWTSNGKTDDLYIGKQRRVGE